MSARQVRVETRSRHQNDLKRVMHSTEKVRKWEKKWVRVEETSLQIFKWMPVAKNEEREQILAPTLSESLTIEQQKLSMTNDNTDFSHHHHHRRHHHHHQDVNKKNLESIELRAGGEVKPNVAAAPVKDAATMPAGLMDGKMNGSGDGTKINETDEQRLNDNNYMDMGATTTTTTLHSISNKRPHEGDEAIIDSTSKRVKTTNILEATMTTTTATNIRDLGGHSLAPMQSVEVVDVKHNPVSVLLVQQTDFTTATNETRSHPQQAVATATVAAAATITQPQHVQPSTATTTSAIGNNGMYEMAHDGPKLASNGDVEMMDTEESTGDSCSVPNTNSNHDTSSTSTTNLPMEDFSTIARTVTEQIVLKVSDCYGGDS